MPLGAILFGYLKNSIIFVTEFKNKYKMKNLAKKLGFGNLQPYSKLFKGGNPLTFGKSSQSMWTISFHINNENEITQIEVHSTYFKVTKEIKAIRDYISKNGSVSVNKAIEIAEEQK